MCGNLGHHHHYHSTPPPPSSSSIILSPNSTPQCHSTHLTTTTSTTSTAEMALPAVETVLELVREVGWAGAGGELAAGPFRRDCSDLCRRVQLLSHLLEEIRDSHLFSSLDVKVNSGGGSSSSASGDASCLSALAAVLAAARRVISDARSVNNASPDSVLKRVGLEFLLVTWQLERVLGVIPYQHFDVSDEVQEQVELVRAQLRRAIQRNGDVSLKLLGCFSSVFGGDLKVEAQDLNKLLKTVQVEDVGVERLDLEMMGELILELFGIAEAETDVRSGRSLAELLTSFKSEADESIVNATNLDGAVVEEKKLEVPAIPADFLCPISLELMRDPVIVATGQTYERSFIQRWIDCGYKTCPKTQQMLQNLTLTPNYVLRSLIQQWCDINKVEQPLGTISGRMRNSDGSIQDASGDWSVINKLVRKLSSNNLLEEQRSAASEVRLLAKRSGDNRILIAEAGAIPLLVGLLSIDDLRMQEHSVTSLLNLSINENNKGLIMLAGAVPHIVEVLKKGSMEARENAAATLFSLSLTDENKIVIGASGAIKALVDLLQRGSLRGKKDAATALFNLCIYQGNKARAVRAGILAPLMNMLTESSDGMVDEALTILSVLASHQEGKVAIAKANAIPVLIDLLRTGLPRNKENATAILLALCKKDSENLACIGRLGAMIPLTELARNGTDRSKRKATSLLEYLAKIKQT